MTPSKNSSAVNNLRREAAAAGVDPRRLFFSKCERAPPVGPARNGLLHQTQRVNVDSAEGWIAAAVPLRHASDVPHRYVGWERHLRRARAADVFADSFTYNAHTTSVDVLWAGVPVLSRSAPAPRQQ